MTNFKVVNCKHGLPSYHLENGTVKHTCMVCTGELSKEKKSKRVSSMVKFSTDKFYCDSKTLLHLIEYGRVIVKSHENYYDNFKKDFKMITKKDPDLSKIQKNGIANTYSYSCDIKFKKDSGLKFNDEINVVTESKNVCRIRNNEFAGYLFNHGFEMSE